MATFPNITPTYNQRKSSAPKKRIITFADGYEQRINFGLPAHQNPKIYSLTYDVSETEGDVIEAFLDSRAHDQASFDFTPPGEGFTKTGTYVQTANAVGISITNHGIALGDTITVDFTSGGGTDQVAVVSFVTNDNLFGFNSSVSVNTSGNVTVTLSGQSKYVCESWSKTIPYVNRATIQATFREVFEP